MNDSPNNSNDVQSKLSIIDPSLGTYRSRYKKSGLKHSFKIGFGTAAFAAIILMFFVDTGIILFALIIGVFVGWLVGQKERKFFSAVRVEYLAAVKAEFAAMVEHLRQTHTEIFDEESGIGFKRLTEIIVLNRLDLDDGFKLRDDFMDFAIDQKAPSDFLNTQLLSINLEQILDIKEVKFDDDAPLEDFYYHNFIGFGNLNVDINNYYVINYRLDGVIKTVICSNKVFNHISDYMKMEGVFKDQPKQTNAEKNLQNLRSDNVAENKVVFNSKPYSPLPKRKYTGYVLAGDYENCMILIGDDFSGFYEKKPINAIYLDLAYEFSALKPRVRYKTSSQFVEISKETIESWEVITEESQKSVSSSLVRGLVGGALLGPLGLVVGATTGSKTTEYNIAVNWKDGKKSIFLLGTNDYKLFLKIVY